MLTNASNQSERTGILELHNKNSYRVSHFKAAEISRERKKLKTSILCSETEPGLHKQFMQKENLKSPRHPGFVVS